MLYCIIYFIKTYFTNIYHQYVAFHSYYNASTDIVFYNMLLSVTFRLCQKTIGRMSVYNLKTVYQSYMTVSLLTIINNKQT